jgi:hypothetical protein
MWRGLRRTALAPWQYSSRLAMRRCPAAILNCDEEVFDALETNLFSLPEAPGTDDEYARRGLYVFDWSDIHGGRLNAYERIARPSAPISLDDLAHPLRARFEVAVFDLEFKDMPVLDVRTYLKCVEPVDHPYQVDWGAKHPDQVAEYPIQETPIEQKGGLLASAVKAFRQALKWSG